MRLGKEREGKKKKKPGLFSGCVGPVASSPASWKKPHPASWKKSLASWKKKPDLFSGLCGASCVKPGFLKKMSGFLSGCVRLVV